MTEFADGTGDLAEETMRMGQDESDELRQERQAYGTWAWEGGAQ